MAEANEIWKPVVGYENLYEVSDLGRVKRIAPGSGTYVGRILKPIKMSNGYIYARLDRAAPHFTVHRIVARAFLGEPPTSKHDVNHKNGIRDDNRIENLEWMTRKENIHHSITVLRGMTLKPSKPRGTTGRRPKISDETVEAIKARLSEERSPSVIASEFGVGATTVAKIRDGLFRKPHSVQKAMYAASAAARKQRMLERGISAPRINISRRLAEIFSYYLDERYQDDLSETFAEWLATSIYGEAVATLAERALEKVRK